VYVVPHQRAIDVAVVYGLLRIGERLRRRFSPELLHEHLSADPLLDIRDGLLLRHAFS